VGGDTRLEQRLVPHKTQMLKSVFYTKFWTPNSKI
jgi:hypothetical protein